SVSAAPKYPARSRRSCSVTVDILSPSAVTTRVVILPVPSACPPQATWLTESRTPSPSTSARETMVQLEPASSHASGAAARAGEERPAPSIESPAVAATAVRLRYCMGDAPDQD